MKLFTLTYLLIIFTSSALISACPICVAKVQQNSQPFFVDEFYVAYEDDITIDINTTGTGS